MRKSFKTFIFLSFLLNIGILTTYLKPNSEFSDKWRKIKEAFDNFATVDPGKLYRCKQLGAKKFNYYIKKYGIKTIVNLRGINQNKKWWIKEKEITLKNNIEFYNISMSASKLPKKEHILELLNIYDNAKKPILIHCQAGANRTGEAAALWKLYKQGTSKKIALKQLSIKYGHLKYTNSAKDFFISIWNGKTWLEKEYNPQNYPHYN